MADDPYETRKRLTFEQAEGVETLPAQLRRGEVSRALRARLWSLIYSEMTRTKSRSEFDTLSFPWRSILSDHHVFRLHEMANRFSPRLSVHVDRLSNIFDRGTYVHVLGFVQFVLRAKDCPPGMDAAVGHILKQERAAYRVMDGTTIVPIGSEEEAEAIAAAFSAIGSANLKGAREHLRAAGEALTAGNFADSVRESIHAVESAARVLGGANSLKDALVTLEKTSGIHPAMREGFGKLYGYTSDEKGIRHPLLEESAAAVDETDALFMFGACASFVTYLVNRTRETPTR